MIATDAWRERFAWVQSFSRKEVIRRASFLSGSGRPWIPDLHER